MRALKKKNATELKWIWIVSLCGKSLDEEDKKVRMRGMLGQNNSWLQMKRDKKENKITTHSQWQKNTGWTWAHSVLWEQLTLARGMNIIRIFFETRKCHSLASMTCVSGS